MIIRRSRLEIAGAVFVALLFFGWCHQRDARIRLDAELAHAREAETAAEGAVAAAERRAGLLRDSLAVIDSLASGRNREAERRIVESERRVRTARAALREAGSGSDSAQILIRQVEAKDLIIEDQRSIIGTLRGQLVARDRLIAAQDSASNRKDELLAAKDAVIAQLEEKAAQAGTINLGLFRVPDWVGYVGAAAAGAAVGSKL